MGMLHGGTRAAHSRARDLLTAIEDAALSTDSACGHTLRNVMCSEEAGVALDEPFDCLPDARAASDAILARSRQLNVELPSRINMAFGGSPRCWEDARIQDAAFVSVVVGRRPGYELWAGGSLGKAPRLAIRLTPFLPREDVLPAAEALIEVFCTHGDLEHPARGRLKFVVDAFGEPAFRAAWEQALEAARRRPRTSPAPAPVEVLADLADRHGDGHLVLSRDQDVVLRNVAGAAVPAIRSALGERGLHLVGEAHVARVRACTGSAMCALGISGAPDTAWELVPSPALGRSSSLRVHVSGCPNSCAQHQAGDIGLAGETLSATVHRLGIDAFAAHLEAQMDQRWATGPEPEAAPAALASRRMSP